MGFQTILLELDRLTEGAGSIATVRLNRPDRMNAVIEQMYLELQEALARLAREDARVLILTGTVRVKDGVARQAFCAGADLKEHATGRRGPAERRAYIELAHETTRRLYELPLPVIAAVNGPARGAGAELVLCCDLVLMADDASLGFPECGLGTCVGGGATWHLPRLVGLARAKELVYTGRVLDGPAAVEAGLALRSVPIGRLADEARALAELLAGQAPRSLVLAKALLQGSEDGTLAEALAGETEAILECMQTEDWKEGARAFSEGRRPQFSGR